MIGSARKDSMIMARFKTFAAFAALGMSGAACGPVAENGLTTVSNPSLYSVNQPVVQRTDFVFDVASSGDGVPTAELARLEDWFRSIQLGYGDRVSVADSGYAGPRTRGDIASIVEAHGLLLNDDVPFGASPAQPGFVRVIVSRMSASVPGCPTWEDPQIGASTQTSTNFGCSVNSNLAQMIADPNDLVLGQTGSIEGDGGTAAKAIKSYRDRPQTGAGGTLKQEAGGNKQ